MIFRSFLQRTSLIAQRINRSNLSLIILSSTLWFASCSSADVQPVPGASETVAPNTSLLAATLTSEPALEPLLSVTPTISPNITASKEDGPLAPVAQGADIRIDGWSPNGVWLGYWVYTQEDLENASYPTQIGRLYFLNNQTGEICEHLDLISSNYGLQAHYDPRIIWQPNGQTAVYGLEEAWIGAPCGDFASVPTSEIVLPAFPNPSLSPNAIYQARAELRESTELVIKATTTIIKVSTGEIETSVEWEIDQGVGELGLGGEWVTDELFLIYETRDQGPLLIRIEDKVLQIAPELFGIPRIVNTGPNQSVNLQAYASVVENTNTYHILLFGTGVEEGFPFVQLYHSETGEVEELPYPHLWHRGFSPDGRWVLLDARPNQDGYESYEFWLRSADPPGSVFRLFSEGTTLAYWSPDGKKLALGYPGKFSVLTFPEGEEVGSWNTGEYSNNYLVWSPNGAFIATAGNIPGEFDAALFVVPVP